MTKINNQPTSAINEDAQTLLSSLTIKEVQLNSSRVQLAVFPEQQKAVSEKVQTACGLTLPSFGEKSQNSQNSENSDITILATQPNKWLLISEEKPAWFADIVDNETAFINEQSSAFSVIEITGAGSLALMQQLSFIDWQTAKPVVLTQLASDYNGIVERLGDTPADGYRIYTTRSMAKSFWEMLKILAQR